MTGHHKRMLGFVGVLVFLFSNFSLVYASGFTIYEQGVRALGRGGAFAATADDPTAIFFNPAGIGQLKGTHFTSGLSAIEPALLRFHPNAALPGPTERFFHSTLLTPQKGFDGEISNNFFFPAAMYFTQSINDRVTVGYGVYFPFALQTDFTNFRNDAYPPVTVDQNGQRFSNRYPGRFASSRAILNVTMHNPTVGIEVNKNFYLGIGFDVAHADVTLEQSFLSPDDPGTLQLAGAFAQQLFPQDYAANPAAAARSVVALLPEGRARLSGEANAIGGNAGILVKIPRYNTNLAVAYRTPITLRISGESAFSFAPQTVLTPFIGGTLASLFPSRVGASAVLKLPPTYTFGIANHSIKNTELAFDFVFQDYRTVKNFPINFATHTAALHDQIIPVSNRPSLQYRFGVERKHSESTSYRFGYYYDVSPLPQKDVGVLEPDSNRHGVTAGLTVALPQRLQLLPGKTTVDFNYMAIFFQKRTVATATNIALGLAGEWDAFANVFGVGLNVDMSRKKAPVVQAHPTATCTVETSPIMEGKSTNVTALISDFDLDSVGYSWSTNGGKVEGSDSTVVFDASGVSAGTYLVTAKVSDKKGNQAICSVNVVVQAAPKPNRNPTVTCSADRTSLIEGESTGVHASASDPDGDPLTYTWTASAGRVSGTGADVRYDSAGAPAGTTATVSVEVSDGRGGTASCSSSIQITAAPKPKPEPISCLSAGFPANSARINNVDKACLDDVSLKMQNDPRSTLSVTGFCDRSEAAAKALATKRAESAKAYLVKEKKLDASRIDAAGAAPAKGANAEERMKNRRVEIVFYPEGTRQK
jgi:long-subunit fatty acid transport protein/outer membrane protein OmpA-like peptidoglycan-associated protein